ncbi:dihydroflavonol 4-reductase [Tamlana sedimentorum]|uniref:Dihydroflavonol 4-reductase n=1 Tax=Neotamlana sedimentorum TaxID=1435349 RepID=A0A0D7W766_9FLAO|nr:NAD-dependent epimerase/dehydratase family protein [Tamlana sedimentorum]KJD34960.1 dihydroflavonol 4-reductase [Tamlana sedimentorum]
MKKLGIIGGAGFIGSHITKLFLEHKFEVKVSTTNISNHEKFTHLTQLKHSNHLHISELDIENKKQLQTFIEDCDIVVHCGTPFQLDVQNAENSLLQPTLNGTQNLLEVIKQTPHLEKVVFMASVAVYNLNFPLPATHKKANDTYSENDIATINPNHHPYAQSKYLANKLVTDFVKSNPDLEVDIISLSPVMVMGKSLSNRSDSTSTNIQFQIKNKIAPNAFMKMLFSQNIDLAIVNVLDVAQSVLNATNISNLHGQNFLISSESYTVSDVSLMLNNKAPLKAPKLIYKNHRAIKSLGVSFQPVKTTLNN